MRVKKQQSELDMEQQTSSKSGKGLCQGCILSPCLFNLYAEYIMRNAGLDEAQAGIKIARRNINNLRYADDTNLMTESEGERGRKGQESLRTGSWRCLEVLGPQFFPAMKFHGVWTWMSLDSWEE